LDYPHYNPNSDHRPLADDELDALDALLAQLPEAMNVELLDGYLTGLLVGPRPLASLAGADWLPIIWGGDTGDSASATPFASQKQKKRLMMLVLRHVHDIDTRLKNAPEDWQPVFSVASADGLDPGTSTTADAGDDDDDEDLDLHDELADAQDWCAGFLEACALDPEGWEALFDDAELGPALLPIAVLGGEADLGQDDDDAADEPGDADASVGDEVAGLLDDPHEVDRLSHAAAEVVLVLHQRRLKA
jgi:uncharacterized protein